MKQLSRPELGLLKKQPDFSNVLKLVMKGLHDPGDQFIDKMQKFYTKFEAKTGSVIYQRDLPLAAKKFNTSVQSLHNLLQGILVTYTEKIIFS